MPDNDDTAQEKSNFPWPSQTDIRPGRTSCLMRFSEKFPVDLLRE